MSGHLEMIQEEPKRKSMFDAVFKKWLPSSFIARPSRHPYSPVTLRKQGSSPRVARNTEGMRLTRNGEAVRLTCNTRRKRPFGWAASAQRTKSVPDRAFRKPSGFLLTQE